MIFRNRPTDLCGVIADRYDARRDFARGYGGNEPTVRETPRASKGGLAAAADPQRRSALLVRSRQQRQVTNRIELSLEVNLLLSPQFLHQHDRLVAPFAPFFLAHPRRVEVTRIIAADADYEQKPSFTEEIERSKLLGKNYGMARR